MGYFIMIYYCKYHVQFVLICQSEFFVFLFFSGLLESREDSSLFFVDKAVTEQDTGLLLFVYFYYSKRFGVGTKGFYQCSFIVSCHLIYHKYITGLYCHLCFVYFSSSSSKIIKEEKSPGEAKGHRNCITATATEKVLFTKHILVSLIVF